VASLKSLVLTNYRNHSSVSLQFGDSINIIVGGNAQGKTNILESIYFLGRGRSFRSKDHKDLVSWGEDLFRIDAEFQKKEGKSRATAYIDDNRRVIKVDGKKKRITGLNVILFVPQDITIFRDSPNERRRFIDDFFSGIDEDYRSILREYNRVLLQRNRILKLFEERDYDEIQEELEVWTDRLVSIGSRLIQKREEWIERLNLLLPDMYRYMGGVGKSAEMRYLPNVLPDNFAEKLEAKEDIELIKGVTMYGPHRDDWSIDIEDMDVRAYGSQGQMRVTVLAIKMVELYLMKERFGESPVLMLDDVISELDKESSKKLLDFVSKMSSQVFITSTDHQILADNLAINARLFRLENGTIQQG